MSVMCKIQVVGTTWYIYASLDEKMLLILHKFYILLIPFPCVNKCSVNIMDVLIFFMSIKRRVVSPLIHLGHHILSHGLATWR